jgi:hypothetical protein
MRFESGCESSLIHRDTETSIQGEFPLTQTLVFQVALQIRFQFGIQLCLETKLIQECGIALAFGLEYIDSILTTAFLVGTG